MIAAFSYLLYDLFLLSSLVPKSIHNTTTTWISFSIQIRVHRCKLPRCLVLNFLHFFPLVINGRSYLCCTLKILECKNVTTKTQIHVAQIVSSQIFLVMSLTLWSHCAQLHQNGGSFTKRRYGLLQEFCGTYSIKCITLHGMICKHIV